MKTSLDQTDTRSQRSSLEPDRHPTAAAERPPLVKFGTGPQQGAAGRLRNRQPPNSSRAQRGKFETGPTRLETRLPKPPAGLRSSSKLDLARFSGCRAGPIRNLTGWRAGPVRNRSGPLAPERLTGVTRAHSKPDWSQRPARAGGAQKNPAGCRPRPLCTPRGGRGKGKRKGGKERGGGGWVVGAAKNHSTQDSHVVPHHGTNWAALRLTAQIGRDAVLSESYGRGYWCTCPPPKSPPSPHPSPDDASAQTAPSAHKGTSGTTD